MTLTAVTKETFAETVKSGIVLIDFWAAWCGPCRSFAPTFEAAAARHPGVTFGKVDTEDQPELAGAFNIRSIPTLMVLRDGVLLSAEPGAVHGAVLDAIIAEVSALDMDAVRRSVEESELAAAASAESGVN